MRLRLARIRFLSISPWHCCCSNCKSAMMGMLRIMSQWNTRAPGEIFKVEWIAALAEYYAAVLISAVLMIKAALLISCGGWACIWVDAERLRFTMGQWDQRPLLDMAQWVLFLPGGVRGALDWAIWIFHNKCHMGILLLTQCFLVYVGDRSEVQ